jgi:tetratricopeptide (TPR) repeat protein
MMVIDPALFGLGALRAGVNPEYCRPMRMKEWEKAIMADTRPMVVELKEKFPHSQGVFSILEIAPFYMGETVADAKAYARFGKMLEDEGLPQEAESAYKHSMELNPNFAGANYMLGQLYSKTGRHQEAEQQLRTAIQKMPKFPSAHVQLGQLLETQGCIQEAEAEYQITLKIKPDDEEAQQRLKQLQAKKSK